MAGTCRIRLLGGFEVEVGGRPVPPQAWRGDGAAELVMVLALEPSHRLTRAQAADRIWPHLPARDADRQLDRALKDAWKALHDGRAVTVEGDRLRLWPHGDLQVDAHTFAALAKHARLPEERQRAASLYRGDLLPHLEAAWTEPVRTRLRLVHLELLRDPGSAAPTWTDLRAPVFAVEV